MRPGPKNTTDSRRSLGAGDSTEASLALARSFIFRRVAGWCGLSHKFGLIGAPSTFVNVVKGVPHTTREPPQTAARSNKEAT